MNVKPKLPEKRGVSSLEAPEFHPGTVLEADQLKLMVTHTKQLSRLLFRSLLGCGVVCGLVVRAQEKCSKLHVTVACGLALDCCGNPIEVPSTQELVIDLCGATIPEPLWVVLRHRETSCAPRAALCSDDDEETSVYTRIREGFEIRLADAKPECACSCAPPKPAPAKPAAVEVDPDAPQAAQVDAGEVHVDNVKPQAMFENVRERVDERARTNPCRCADPTLGCHQKHYAGECCCDCGECCDCEWIVLAQLENAGTDDEPKWTADHAYRRFIRPVLMSDPVGKLPKENQP